MRIRYFFYTILSIGIFVPLSSGWALEKVALPLATVEFPPFHYKKNGQVAGFITDIVKTTLKRMGYEAKIDIYPSKRGKQLAERGKLAGIFAFTKKPERLTKYHFTRPLGTIRDVFFKRKDRSIHWEKMDDLKPYLIGATETYNYAPVFLNAIREKRIHTEMVVSQTPEILHLRKLVGKRIDLAICEISLCRFIIKNNAPAFDDLDYIDQTIGPVRTFHLGISRKWPDSKELTMKFDAALIQLEERGEVADIYASYGFIPYRE